MVGDNNSRFYINRMSFDYEDGNSVTRKELDNNGFLIAYDVPIAKSGIQQYAKGELRFKGDPNSLVNIYRDPAQFKNKEILDSFEGMPLTDDHPREGKVTANNYNRVTIGTISGIYEKDGDLYAKKITIFDKEAIRDILDKRMNQLSIGFKGIFKEKSGIYNGQKFQGVEEIINGNHLALCGLGKAGEKYAINSLREGKITMPDNMVDISDIIKQSVTEAIRQMKPSLSAGNTVEKADDCMTNESYSEASGKEVSKEKGEDSSLNSEEDLKKAEEKDKDSMNSLRNVINKQRALINAKNSEISVLNVQIDRLQEAMTEATETVHALNKKIQSHSLTHAMSAPDSRRENKNLLEYNTSRNYAAQAFRGGV